MNPFLFKDIAGGKEIFICGKCSNLGLVLNLKIDSNTIIEEKYECDCECTRIYYKKNDDGKLVKMSVPHSELLFQYTPEIMKSREPRLTYSEMVQALKYSWIKDLQNKAELTQPKELFNKIYHLNY